MKKIYSCLIVFALISTVFIVQSCNKDDIFDPIPPEVVVVVVENEVPAHTVNIEVTNANANATNRFPANPKITLEGADVESGLIYSAAGNAATTATDNVKIENNILTLVVKKGTVISAAKPIKFYVKASADNFVSNFEEITITSVDKLQYINLTLLNIANLPKGITNTTASTPASGGTIQEDFVVNVSSTTDGVTENVVSATFPANTTFFDANNTAIKTAGDLNVSVTNFNPAVEGATGDIPGGINATTATGGDVIFSLAGAVTINASIGQRNIKSFSNPIPFEIKLSSTFYNETTKGNLKAGDKLPIWSKDEGSVIWTNEGFANIEADGAGKLRTIIQVSHLSTWMVGNAIARCEGNTVLTYNSTNPTYVNILLEFRDSNKKLLLSKSELVTGGSQISVDLPEGKIVDVNVFRGTTVVEGQLPFATFKLQACQQSEIIPSAPAGSNPTLKFDLKTICNGVTRRYNGPIDYKLQSESTFRPFTISKSGTVSTQQLAFGQTYTFRVTGTVGGSNRTITKRREVIQSEFTLRAGSNNIWDFTKQEFFETTQSCNQ